jgi:hypothetical protein
MDEAADWLHIRQSFLSTFSSGYGPMHPADDGWKSGLLKLGTQVVHAEKKMKLQLTCYFVMVGVYLLCNRNPPARKGDKNRRAKKARHAWTTKTLCLGIDTAIATEWHLRLEQKASKYSDKTRTRIKNASFLLVMVRVLRDDVISLATILQRPWNLDDLSRLRNIQERLDKSAVSQRVYQKAYDSSLKMLLMVLHLCICVHIYYIYTYIFSLYIYIYTYA